MGRIRVVPSAAEATLLGSCLMVLAGLLLLAAPAARATFPSGRSAGTAFQSNRDGNFEIYSSTEYGGNQTRLTNNTAFDGHPRWSPDGTKIAFQSDRDGNFEIYTMNADGSGQTRITNNPAFDEIPAWSPDGTKIVFDSGRDDPHGEIYTMNADGSNVTRLTNDPGYDFASNWSPDGSKIAWQSSRIGGQYDIYTMNPDGTSQTRITTSPATDEWPNWSISGTLYYDSNATGDFDIYTTSGGGTQQAGDQQAPAPPSYLHTGYATTYQQTVGGDSDIYIGSSSPTAIVTGPALDQFPDRQAVPINHVRPRGATPLYLPLVPAYKSCSATNSLHRPSIGGINDCVPPQIESSYLTVGTPDVNGAGAKFIGSVRIDAHTTSPEDGLIKVSTTDVRCVATGGGCAGGPLADYTDDLRFDAVFRLTDKGNYGGRTSGTSRELPMNFSVPCTSTPSTTIGSTCSITTSINTVYGVSAVTDGLGAIWQLTGPIQLFDGGADGVGSTTADNTLFAVGGVFFP
jgi:WD40-like Beta Propeller Repeat